MKLRMKQKQIWPPAGSRDWLWEQYVEVHPEFSTGRLSAKFRCKECLSSPAACLDISSRFGKVRILSDQEMIPPYYPLC